MPPLPIKKLYQEVKVKSRMMMRQEMKMMLSRFSEDRLRKAISNLDVDKYDCWGLRVCDKKYEIGDICDNSHQLYQDPMYADAEMTELLYPYIEDGIYAGSYDGGELDGVCAINLNPEEENSIGWAIETIGYYEHLGKYLYIVAGDRAIAGNDEGEIIISDAEVIWRGEKNEK